MTDTNAIPVITDPLGRGWDQPADMRVVPMDDTHVILTANQMRRLMHYDRSMPSGVYAGKCWLRTNGATTWLVWYGAETAPGSAEFRVCYRVVLQLSEGRTDGQSAQA